MRIYMAPMEGVVDHHMRKLFAEIGGVDLFVTEFVRVTDARLPDRVFRRYAPELEAPINVPVRVQLLGSNALALAQNAKRVAAMGAPAVDLNFGCPAKTVNKHRGGACLLNEPGLIFDIVAAVRDALPPQVPVTAKIRLGYLQRAGYVETAKAIAAAGASELVVHARSKSEGYRPPAYWHQIAEIKDAVRIPVIANGEIWTTANYQKSVADSGCPDVMLGRGLLARPDLALAIKALHNGLPHRYFGWDELRPWLVRFQRETLDFYPRKFCGNRLKQWLMYLSRTYPEAVTLFEQIKRLRDPDEIDKALTRS